MSFSITLFCFHTKTEHWQYGVIIKLPWVSGTFLGCPPFPLSIQITCVRVNMSSCLQSSRVVYFLSNWSTLTENGFSAWIEDSHWVWRVWLTAAARVSTSVFQYDFHSWKDPGPLCGQSHAVYPDSLPGSALSGTAAFGDTVCNQRKFSTHCRNRCLA